MEDYRKNAIAIAEKLQNVEKKIHYYTQLQRALEFVQQDFSLEITMKEAAEQAAMSRSAFSRRFKQSTGLSFHQYLILEGLRRAVAAIEASDASLTNVALEAGFESLWSLEYNFKRHIGCDPSTYRDFFLSTV